MRLDNVYWQKSKINNVTGFLSDAGDTVLFTKYKGSYTPTGAKLYTKEQIRTNRLLGKIKGALQPEKELFRFNKQDVQDLQMTYSPGGEMMGYKTSPTAIAQFKVAGVEYLFTYAAKTEEESRELGKILGEQ